jgi:hypothetical protein
LTGGLPLFIVDGMETATIINRSFYNYPEGTTVYLVTFKGRVDGCYKTRIPAAKLADKISAIEGALAFVVPATVDAHGDFVVSK